MRSSLTRTPAGRAVASPEASRPAPAVPEVDAVLGMLRRSAIALLDQPRRPPLGRRLRRPATDRLPTESRILFRAGGVVRR
jgi:hypothetical protein